MHWRDFLQPTKAKLLVALLIYLLFVPLLHVEIECLMTMAGGICPPSKDFSFLDALIFQGNPAYTLEFLLAGIPISYLASCLLAAIYSRIRGSAFLCPSAAKLALAALLAFALVPFVQVSGPYLMCDFHWWDCQSSGLDTMWIYLLIDKRIDVFTGISFPVLLAGLLASYFASCFLFFLLSKYHKKK